jgi:hypothetical protein
LEELISSAVGSPVSRGPLPGSNEAQKMTVTSGRSWLPLLKTYGLDGSLAKMSEVLLTSRWASSAAFLTWKASDIKPRHLLFQLAPSMPRTDATGYGSWPTPAVAERTSAGSGEAFQTRSGTVRRRNADGTTSNMGLAATVLWPTPTTQEIEHSNMQLSETGRRLTKDKKNSHSLNLADRVKMWPTPRSCSAMSAENVQNRANDKFPNLESVVARTMWPTPNANDDRDRGNLSTPSVQRRARLGKQLNLSMVVSEESGALNPEWVEWLMGFPAGWTNLTADELQPESKTEKQDLKPSEMPSSRKSLRKSAKQSSQEKTD